LVAIYQPLGVRCYLHLRDIREGVEFSEVEGKFAKLALSHTVSGPVTLSYFIHSYFCLCLPLKLPKICIMLFGANKSVFHREEHKSKLFGGVKLRIEL
jgi:hypothetical protein